MFNSIFTPLASSIVTATPQTIPLGLVLSSFVEDTISFLYALRSLSEVILSLIAFWILYLIESPLWIILPKARFFSSSSRYNLLALPTYFLVSNLT